METKIPIEELTPGMYIIGIDRSWFSTPFLFHNFVIKTEAQIREIREAGITHVFIDREKSEVVAEEIVKAEPPQGLEDERPKLSGAYTKAEFKQYSHQKEERLQINRNTLIKDSYVDFSLYTMDGFSIRPLASYENRDILITEDMLDTPGDLMIDLGEMQKYKSYLKSLSVKPAGNYEAQKLKNAVVKENTKILVKELMDDPRSGNAVQLSKGAVEDLISAIHDSRGIMSSILTLNKYDYYTYTHSVEVCVLTLSLAMALGIYKDHDLMTIGIGSLLHDIGKSEVPPEVLNKPGKLTDDEFRVMKQHVPKGAKLLRIQKDVTPESFYPLLEHHEKLSGMGYPFGIRGESIHQQGRITAIADTYDAITTARPYQKQHSPFEALTIIQKQSDNYDVELFKVFVKILGSDLDAIRKGIEADRVQ